MAVAVHCGQVCSKNRSSWSKSKQSGGALGDAGCSPFPAMAAGKVCRQYSIFSFGGERCVADLVVLVADIPDRGDKWLS